MYSPGSSKLAVVVALPVKTAPCGPLKSSFSTAGLSLEKVTEPGPRNLLHEIATGGVFCGVATRATFASSATHTVNVTGSGDCADREMLCPRGPCTNCPSSENPMNGGVLLLASLNGEISHKGASRAGTSVCFPLTRVVH